ncbi:MAG: OprD family outer membrane porin [Reyranellaceae bacterium]
MSDVPRPRAAHRNGAPPVLRRLALAAGLALAIAAPGPTHAEPAQSSGDEFWRGLYTDAALTVHFRSYVLSRDVPEAPDLGAWANGGWIGYQSGWFFDLVRFGLVGYGSAPFWAPEDKDGTLLLRQGQRGYAVLGQAYLSLKLWEQIITGYRQLVDQPEVNPQDNRMTPNTFEGVSIAGKVSAFDYYGAFLWAMKKRNETKFRDMAEIAGAPDYQRSMWLAGIGVTPIDDLKLRASTYVVPDILWSSYADLTWLTPLIGTSKLKLAGQFMYQQSIGDDLLTGASFDTWAAGIRADVTIGPLTVTGGYTKIGDNANYRSPYGTWAGYTSLIVTDFNRANEGAIMVGGTLDFGFIGLPGLSTTVLGAIGDNARDPVTRADLSDKSEFDFTVDYRFKAECWPEVLRPLWLRARAAYVDEDLVGGPTRKTKDYRFIVNYEWVFNKSTSQ